MASFTSETCVICKQPERENDKLRRPNTGLQQIINYSEIFNLSDLKKTLLQASGKNGDQTVVKIRASCQKSIGNEIRKRKWKRSGGSDAATSS